MYRLATKSTNLAKKKYHSDVKSIFNGLDYHTFLIYTSGKSSLVFQLPRKIEWWVKKKESYESN